MNGFEGEYSKERGFAREAEGRDKRQEVLSRLTDEFIAGSHRDPFAYKVIETLMRGADEYEIIEQILKSRAELFAEVVYLKETANQGPIRDAAGRLWFPPGWKQQEETGK